MKKNKDKYSDLKEPLVKGKHDFKNVIYMTVVIAITAIVFSNTIKHDFTNLDDQKYIHDNPYIKDLSLTGIKKIFTEPYFSNYHPLTTLTYAVEYALFGLSPTVFHFSNYLLHLLNTLLVFLFIRLLTNSSEISFITALLFALHPMHVESVAWIAERKDVLYTFFFLASLIYFVKFVKNKYKSPTYIVLAFVFFLCSLLSKSAAVVLPPVVLLCLYFTQKKIEVKDVIISLPFFTFAVLFGIIALKTQENAIVDLSKHFSSLNRIFIVFYAVYFYIIRFIYPYNLSALHSYTTLDSTQLPFEFYITPIVLALIIVLIFLSKKQWRHYLIFGLLFYLVNILLVIQIIPLGEAYVSERYAYVPYIGLSVIAAYAFVKLRERYKAATIGAGLIFMGFLTISTWQQNKVWANSITLWTKVIEVNPNIATAYNNRGIAKSKIKYYNGALNDYNKSLELAPGNATTFYNRGEVQSKLGKYKEAISDYNRAIRINPSEEKFYYNRGNAKGDIGDHEGAIEDYSRALEMNPNYVEAVNNRGIAKSNMGDYIGAIKDYDIALALNANNAEAYNNRGVAYAMTSQFESAIKDYKRAIAINSEYSDAYFNMGVVCIGLQNNKEGCINFEKALQNGNSRAGDMLNAYCK